METIFEDIVGLRREPQECRVVKASSSRLMIHDGALSSGVARLCTLAKHSPQFASQNWRDKAPSQTCTRLVTTIVSFIASPVYFSFFSN